MNNCTPDVLLGIAASLIMSRTILVTSGEWCLQAVEMCKEGQISLWFVCMI